MTFRIVRLMLVSMSLFIAGCTSGPKRDRAEEARLVGHWISVEEPSGKGLKLQEDGRGTLDGSGASGRPMIAWRVVKRGELEIAIVDDGGIAGYASIPYVLNGERLTIRGRKGWRPIQLIGDFTRAKKKQ